VNDGKQVFWLEVSDPDLDTGTLRVTDYSTDTGDFRPGTIGALNGMNHPSVVIEPTMAVEAVLAYGHAPDEIEPVDTTEKLWRA